MIKQHSNRAAYDRHHKTSIECDCVGVRPHPAERPHTLRRTPQQRRRGMVRPQRSRRRRFSGLWLLLLLAVVAVGCYLYLCGWPWAADEAMTFYAGSDQVLLNGETVTLNHRVWLRGDELMLAADDLEPLGFTVVAKDNGVMVSLGRREAVYTAGESEALHNGETVTLVTAPFWQHETLYLPLADMLTAVGYATTYTASDFRLDGYPAAARLKTPNCTLKTDKDSYAPGELVTFEVKSSGGSGEIVDYEWTNYQQRYFDPGEITVSVRVKDSHGQWSETASATFTVAGEPYTGAEKFPILMYHHIVKSCDQGEYGYGNRAIMSVDQFEEEMKYLSDNGYTTLFVSEMLTYLEAGKMVPEKTVVLTFDDGYESNFLLAQPILEKYGLKANISVFVEPVVIKSDEGRDTTETLPRLSFDQLAKMIDSGCFEVGSHTYACHDAFVDAETKAELYPLIHKKTINGVEETEDQQARRVHDDLIRSRAILQERLRINDMFFIYPYGVYNAAAMEQVKNAGYSCAITVDEDFVRSSSDLYALERFYVPQSMTIEEFTALLE